MCPEVLECVLYKSNLYKCKVKVNSLTSVVKFALKERY